MLNRAAGRACDHSIPSLAGGVVLMSTYEEFMVILTVALLIVAILSLTHKKQPSCSLAMTGRLFLSV